MGGDAERAEQQGGVVDGGHAPAPYVADDQPGAGGGAHGRVQVPADLRLGLGGQVQGGGAQRAGPTRERGQDHALGGLGDVPDLSSSFARRSRRTQKTTRLTPARVRAMIWASWLAEKSAAGSRTTPMTVWATTARAATAPTVRGPPNDGVGAGAATSSGPRWMWGREDVDDGHRDDPHDRDGDERAALPPRPATDFDRLRHGSSLYRASSAPHQQPRAVRGNPPQG